MKERISVKSELLRSAAKAFTIIELLVAIGVTAVMVTLMLVITTNVIGTWNRTSGNLTTSNQARLVLDQLTSDLQGLIVRQDENAWLMATIQRDQTTASGDMNEGPTAISTTTAVLLPRWNPASPATYKPRGSTSFDPAATRTNTTYASLHLQEEDRGKLENVRFGQAGVWLRFFTLPSGSNTSPNNLSAPRAVGYQLTRAYIGGAPGATRSSPISYILFRAEVNADDTFAAGYDLSGSSDYNDGNGVAGNPGNIRRPNSNTVIANDVIDFGVRIFERDSAGDLVEVFPVRRNAGGVVTSAPADAPFTYVATGLDSPAYTLFGGTAAKTTRGINGSPELIEVMVRILTPEGVRLIQAYETDPGNFGASTAAEIAAKWWEIAEANSEVFTRRISVKANSF